MFGSSKPIFGMLHLPPLPGSPGNKLDLSAIIDWVLEDARALAEGAVDGFVIENFGDTPFYPQQVPSHTVAFMTALCKEVKRYFKIPLGVNVLRNDAEGALAIAAATGSEFIRVNVHTGARVTDQGVLEGSAHRTLRYRKLLGADVKIFADIDVKHSAPLAVRDLKTEVEELVSRGGADAVIVTGSATGEETSFEDLSRVKTAARAAAVIAGSGVDAENVAKVLAVADAVIVGTSLKRDAITTNPVDPERVRQFVQAARTL